MWRLDGTFVNNTRNSFKNLSGEDFPGDSVVKTPCSQWRMAGAQIQYLVWELRSHMLCKKSRKKKKSESGGKNNGRYSRRLKDIRWGTF